MAQKNHSQLSPCQVAARFSLLLLFSQIKLSRVIPNEAKRSEESVYFKIGLLDNQVSLRHSADRNDLHLLMNFNNLTKYTIS